MHSRRGRPTRKRKDIINVDLEEKRLEVVDCIHLAQGMTTNGQVWAW